MMRRFSFVQQLAAASGAGVSLVLAGLVAAVLVTAAFGGGFSGQGFRQLFDGPSIIIAESPQRADRQDPLIVEIPAVGSPDAPIVVRDRGTSRPPGPRGSRAPARARRPSRPSAQRPSRPSEPVPVPVQPASPAPSTSPQPSPVPTPRGSRVGELVDSTVKETTKALRPITDALPVPVQPITDDVFTTLDELGGSVKSTTDALKLP